MRADRFAAVLGVLWAAHDVADHIIQTDAQASTKAGTGRAAVHGMGGHLAGQAACQGIALAGLHAAGVRLTPGRALAGLALSVASHGFLDRRWPVLGLLRRTGSDRFAAPLVRVAEDPRQVELRQLEQTQAELWPVALPREARERLSARLRDLRAGPPPEAGLIGPLPLHGPYLADQALHHAACVLAAAVIAW